MTNEGAAGNVQIAEALQQDFAALGIDMVIDTKEWSVFLNERKAGNFDLARNGWVADFNDPMTTCSKCGQQNGNNDAQLGK